MSPSGFNQTGTRGLWRYSQGYNATATPEQPKVSTTLACQWFSTNHWTASAVIWRAPSMVTASQLPPDLMKRMASSSLSTVITVIAYSSCMYFNCHILGVFARKYVVDNSIITYYVNFCNFYWWYNIISLLIYTEIS